jgi:hypothetical protein
MHDMTMKFRNDFIAYLKGEPCELIVVKTCLCMFQFVPVKI